MNGSSGGVQVGGLKDTVQPYNPHENTGTGWRFDWCSGEAFREAVWNALYTFRDHRSSFLEMAGRGMEQDLSWDKAAQQYEDVLLAAKYQW
jgi:starch synthase